jgi:predicted peroxiredoxin
MKFVYIATKGADDPTLASIPYHLAVNGSIEVGHETAIVLAGDAAEMVIGDTIERTEGVGLPSMRDLVAKVRDRRVPVYV